ncbi:MAG: TetR/AcrR family transcriptional regulator [Oscillospiraceae bacterium]|nr:TetR/AcrR family transcriptional regulator [Oscillospiraceae bacterium]
MPPQKIVKETLLEYAFRIAEEKGIDAVTSRSVAKLAGCSIQPVFSHFPTMEALHQATFDYAYDKFVQEILVFEKLPDFLPRTTKWVLDLARNKPNLYHMLYLSNSFNGNILLDVMMDFESNKKMIAKMTELYGIEENTCKDILLRSCLFLMGIATMICVNHMDFSDEQVALMMKQTVSDMYRERKDVHYEKNRFDKSVVSYKKS